MGWSIIGDVGREEISVEFKTDWDAGKGVTKDDLNRWEINMKKNKENIDKLISLKQGIIELQTGLNGDSSFEFPIPTGYTKSECAFFYKIIELNSQNVPPRVVLNLNRTDGRISLNTGSIHGESIVGDIYVKVYWTVIAAKAPV